MASKAEIERLQAVADRAARRGRSLMARNEPPDRPTPVESSIPNSDPMDLVREQVDIVAYRMIQRADSLQSAMHPTGEVVELYRSVERMFPKTHSAEVARQRLAALGLNQGES